MTHTMEESLRWFGVITIYGRLRKNTYGASFFLPKESDKVGAYKPRQNWRVFWKSKALKVRTIIEEYYWTKALMDRCD